MSKWRMSRVFVCLLALSLAFSSVAVSSQEDDACAALIESALDTASPCVDLDENQACYGHLKVEAVFVEGQTGLAFEDTADIVPLAALQQIATTPAKPDDAQWGLAFLQATLTEGPATFVLMGDVTLTGLELPETAAAPEVTPVPASVQDRANVREAPVNGAVITTLGAGTEFQLVGVNAAGDWYQIELEDGTLAFIADFLVTVEDADADAVADAVAELPVVAGEADAPSASGPGLAQAFTFEASPDAPACEGAANAMVVQSLVEEPATLNINDLSLVLRGTAAFAIGEDANGGDLLAIYLLDGELTTTAGDIAVTLAEPGQMLGVTEDGQLGQPASELVAKSIEATCNHVAEYALLPEALETGACDVQAAYVYTITATNDLDWPVVLWIDREIPVPFDAEETLTFPVMGGERMFEVCNEEVSPGESGCGGVIDRTVDTDTTWVGWWPEP